MAGGESGNVISLCDGESESEGESGAEDERIEDSRGDAALATRKTTHTHECRGCESALACTNHYTPQYATSCA